MSLENGNTLETNEGSEPAETVNRIKPKKLSKFKRLLKLAQGKDTVKPSLTLSVKGEEYKGTVTLSSIPDLTPTAVKERAEEEGCKFQLTPEATVGEATAKVSGKKVESDAAEFVKEFIGQ